MAVVTQRQRMRMASVIALLLLWLSSCSCYPLIAEVPEEEDKCFRFNIPEDDDAHMVFLAIPSDLQESGEEWFVNQVSKMTKERANNPRGVLPKNLVDKIPDEVQNAINKFYSDHETDVNSGVKLNVQKPRRPALRNQDFKWFSPIVMNHVVRTHDKHDDFGGGYAICFQNDGDEHEALVVFDVVLVSDEYDDEEEEEGDGVLKAEHLTPLEENLQESISAAQSVLSEMRYMEKREARMRQTADSINQKVKLFSYLSVAILLGVTYVQVTYLKRYFRKKKLM